MPVSFPVFALLHFAQIWLAIPLGVAFSFCYAATRSENPRDILIRAVKLMFELFLFMALVGVVISWAV